MKPYVIYHKSCMDGAAAALAAWFKFQENARYWFATYGDEPPPLAELTGRDVYVLDFSYPRETLEAIAKVASRLVVLDHHKTAEENLAGLPYAHFDMEKSGAVMAWEFFHPDKPLPEMFRYVQDRDLWLWQLPKSAEVSAFLGSAGAIKDFRVLAPYADDDNKTSFDKTLRFDSMVQQGGAILRYQESIVEGASHAAVLRKIGDVPFYVLNATVLISEIGHKLATRMSYENDSRDGRAAIWRRDERKNVYVVSLRGCGDVDLTETAKLFGGGGHQHAAGFSCSALPWQ